MSSITHMIREVWRGKSLMRAYLNRTLAEEMLLGRVLDIGCGSDAHYLDFMPRSAETTMTVLEHKKGDVIDFETDPLPYTSDTFDTVILLNVLEHLYHYTHIIAEAHRVTKESGRCIGFTPFLIRYHPDPHDFFRYTGEALARMVKEGGFRDVRVVPVGEGPFIAAVNLFVLSLPRPVRIVLTLLALPLDFLFLRARPQARAIYPMGYYFTAIK